jgi:hypothetical protein
MKRNFVMAFVFLMFLLPGFLKSQEEQSATTCCFDHDGYAGQCKVTPAEGETCASILEYLNSPGTVGKTYCNNSKWRGGWSQVDCEEDSQE